MMKDSKELLRFTREEYNCGDMDQVCALLRQHKVAFARPGPHWFPTILPPYELSEDDGSDDMVIKRRL